MPLDAPNHLRDQLPADTYYHLVRTLRLTLPPPLTDTPEDLLRRDHAAIARIAALVPANAAEADVAAQFVAASEQWKDCLRLAQLPDSTPEWAAKCRAQATSMMRQSNSALRLLLRMQAAREKRETDNGDRAAWTEHCALSLMAEALGAAPVAQKPSPPPLGAEGQGEVGDTPRFPVRTEAPPPGAGWGEANLVAAAERYAVVYPERAALIRRTGRLPHDVHHFEPPEAALAGALIAGGTPAEAALDREFAAARAA